MLKMGYVVDAIDAVNSTVNFVQNIDIHKKEAHCVLERHEEEIKVEHDIHGKALKMSKQTYLMAAFSSLEKHFQQLTADLINSSRESENDMFDQRNQSFQTIILSASVMFSSLATVIIQGFLPKNANVELYVAYAVTCSFSFLFLFLSIVLCIEVILRASNFMVYRASQHTQQLKESIKKAKEMMKEIRSGTRNYGGDDAGVSDNVASALGVSPPSSPTSRRGSGLHPSTKIIASLSGEALEEEWDAHEERVHHFLQERERLNERAHTFGTSFEDFYKRYCKYWGDLAIFSFYAGTAFLLMAIMVYMWGEFDVTYESYAGAVVAVVLVGVALVWGVCLALYMRVSDKMNKPPRERDDDGEDDGVPAPAGGAGSEVSGSEFAASGRRSSLVTGGAEMASTGPARAPRAAGYAGSASASMPDRNRQSSVANFGASLDRFVGSMRSGAPAAAAAGPRAADRVASLHSLELDSVLGSATASNVATTGTSGSGSNTVTASSRTRSRVST